MSEHKHSCELDLHDCSSSDCDIVEECGKPATLKWKGGWFCAEHYDLLVRVNSGRAY